ncbi:class I SAM-dependent methyltransferase [Phytohabitans houttuyneae]|uniref:Methyltransferase n=1 Tax=Phytohabitans houttuyneae TaxID=1076126 RepID=A0A6V8KM59_9ACTN|nr:class I SAM-dependent methyltransferase [Phytohabitans houttuyneae]GFJ86233.1 methyltransferase [Phytohabitans houttuyneae]
MPGGYAYDNDVEVAQQQHACLSAMLDDFTRTRLSSVDTPAGPFRCLEVGAGAGSIARWLAGRGAAVVATDLKPRHLTAGTGVHVLTHDIVAEPVPDPPYDLVHARLLLIHLPQRERVLAKLAAALRPGGSLVVEDWYIRPEHIVLAAPTPADSALFERYQRMLLDILANDPTWAARIHGEMLAAGLTEVNTAIHAPVWPAGSAGALLTTVNLTLFRDRLLAAGLTAADLDHLWWLVTDTRSGLVIRGHFLYSTIGRAPLPEP